MTSRSDRLLDDLQYVRRRHRDDFTAATIDELIDLLGDGAVSASIDASKARAKGVGE